MSQNRIAITADDYGPHPFINEGTLEAIKQNRITSVGVFTNHYDIYNFEFEIEKLIDTIGDKNIGIGVHLTITSGSPLVYSEDLYLENNLFNLTNKLKLGMTTAHLHAIGRELTAQIVKMKHTLKEYDRTIDHISFHQGIISLFTPYFDVLLRILKDNHVDTTIRTPLPISKDKAFKNHFKESEMKQEGTLRAIRMVDQNLRILGELLDGIEPKNLHLKRKIAITPPNKHTSPDYFFDNFYKRSSAEVLNHIFKNYPRQIGVLRSGEMVVHLGKGNFENLPMHGINHEYFSGRANELKVITEIDLPWLARFHKLELRPMRQLI